MPNYATPFGQAGQVGGAATGGLLGAGAGGLLGALGGVLDAPRQSVYNLGRGISRGLSGEGSWDDAIGALPGALGAGLTGGLALTGVGLPAAIGLGSILGGVSQLAGKSTGREAFNAPEVSDLTGTDEMIPNLIVGALTDPLTYAGGIGGASKGAAVGERAGQAFGRDLEKAAISRPLGYAGGSEKLGGIAEQMMNRGVDAADSSPLMSHIRQVMENPAALAEIPPGATYAGHGQSTMTLNHPSGGVIQLTPGSMSEFGQSSRLNLPDMVQSERSIVHPGAEGQVVRVEHAPRMDTFPHMGPPPGIDAQAWEEAYLMKDKETEALIQKMRNEGADFWDSHLGNVGWDKSGQMKVIDSGAINPRVMVPGSGFETTRSGEGLQRMMVSTDQLHPLAQDITASQPTTIQNFLLKLLGSDKAVQAELAAKLEQQSVKGSPLLDAMQARSAEVAFPGQSRPPFGGFGPQNFPEQTPGFTPVFSPAEGAQNAFRPPSFESSPYRTPTSSESMDQLQEVQAITQRLRQLLQNAATPNLR